MVLLDVNNVPEAADCEFTTTYFGLNNRTTASVTGHLASTRMLALPTGYLRCSVPNVTLHVIR